MTSMDPLEGQLRSLSLELPETGEHLADERMAEIGEGNDPTPTEAAHLAGCDDCCELLVLLGEGLAECETVSSETAPTAPTADNVSIHSFPGRRRRGRVATTGLVLAFATAAAAAWGVYTLANAPGETPKATTAPLSDAVGKSTPQEPTPPAVVPTPKTTDVAPSVALEPTTMAPTPPTTETIEESVIGQDVVPPTATVAPAITPPPKETLRKTPKKARVATPGPLDFPGALTGRKGPRPVNRIPVNGAPRGFGTLRLNAKPSARVFVDGKPHGWTPLLNLRLQSGPHDVQLVYESPLAADKEQRFRVLIQDDETWSTVRDNRRRE